jgi:hypothetical protein
MVSYTVAAFGAPTANNYAELIHSFTVGYYADATASFPEED